MEKQRIMVVEDDPNILELVRHSLAREGYRAICFDTGEKLLLAAGIDPPALVILDLMLPGIQGLEVCRLLKQEPKTRGIPIVILTAKGEERDVIAGLESGADDYLTKPFRPWTWPSSACGRSSGRSGTSSKRFAGWGTAWPRNSATARCALSGGRLQLFSSTWAPSAPYTIHSQILTT